MYINNLNFNQATAYLKYVRISPFKIRRVLDQIRGLSYNDAVLILKFMPYKSCSSILKVLNSAAANAKFNFDADINTLMILEARVDSNSYLKRFRPHAQGRGFPIKKRMSSIVSLVIILSKYLFFYPSLIVYLLLINCIFIGLCLILISKYYITYVEFFTN